MKVKNRKGLKFLTHIFSLILITFVFAACSDEPSDPSSQDGPKSSTTLIYAVASNSLSGNFVQDTTEMVIAAPYVDLPDNDVLVFATTYHQETQQLLRLTKVGNNHHFKVVKEFPNDISSLNPARVTEVIDYVTENYKADSYGLIFWSHSTGSQPYFDPNAENVKEDPAASTRDIQPLQPENNPMAFSFGQDINSGLNLKQEINIDVLADLIPDNLFEYIWFDSCYMSNIESIYQFRNKCKYYVGYPTEVLEYGLPYDLVLPYLARRNPDIITAAEKFFNYYAGNPYSGLRSATVAVTDMSKIEELVDFCNPYFDFMDYTKPYSVDFIRYTRGATGPFYDLGDYVKSVAAAKGAFDLIEEPTDENQVTDVKDGQEKETPEDIWNREWENLINRVVVYKAATPYFLSLPMPQERFTGLSAHIYDLDSATGSEVYYRSYDWFKNIFNK